MDVLEETKKKKYQRFRYSQETLEEALRAISKGELTLCKASKSFQIPKSTLFNKINHKVPWTRLMGPSTELTIAAEGKLAKWIVDKAKLGFPMHPDDVYDTIQSFLNENNRKTKFTDNRPGKKWLQLFLKRHPDVTKRNAEYISKARASVTETSIRQWFSELDTYLEEENALDIKLDPSRIFNADETGVMTCPKTGIILGPKNYKDTYVIANGKEKESITVLCNFSANGKDVPPFVVYPYKRIPAAVINNHPDEWLIGRSDSGWMVSDTFYAYIKLFHEWLLKEKIKLPILLLLDGHKSHINQNMFEFCKNNGIFLFCLYPNATHILQPCDVAIFRPIKLALKKTVRKHKQNTTAPINKQNFSKLFKEAYKNGLKSSAVQNGFRKCGLYPVNPNAVDYSKCIDTRRKDLEKTDLETESEYKNDLRSTLKIIEADIGPEKRKEFEVSYKSKRDHNHPYYTLWAKCKNGLEKSSPIINEHSTSSTVDTPLDLSNASSHGIPNTAISDVDASNSQNRITQCDNSEPSNNLLVTVADIHTVQDEEPVTHKETTTNQNNIVQIPQNANASIESVVLFSEGENDLFRSVNSPQFNNTDEICDFVIDNMELIDHSLTSMTVAPPIDISSVNVNSCNSNSTTEVLTSDIAKKTNFECAAGSSFSITGTTETSVFSVACSTTTNPLILSSSNETNNATSIRMYEKNPILVNTDETETELSAENYTVADSLPLESSLTTSTATCFSRPASSVSSTKQSVELEQFLTYPSIPGKKAINIKKKEPLPYALTGQKYKEYVKKLEDEKKKKEEEIEERKKKRLEFKKTKNTNKRQAPERSEVPKKKKCGPKEKMNPSQMDSQTNIQKEKINSIEAIHTIGKYVIAEFKTPKRVRRFVGKVLSVDLEQEKYKVDFLRKKSAVDNKVNFVKPNVTDITEVAFEDILRTLPEPNSYRRGLISFHDLSFTDVE